MAKKSTLLNLVLNQHNLNQAHTLGPLMDLISTLQPLDEGEWEDFYFSNVKTSDDMSGIVDKFWGLIGQYRAVIETIERGDCEEFVRDLTVTKTFGGWHRRRDQLKAQLLADTGIEFDYLRDHSEDWRPKTFDLDFAAKHPDSEAWLGVKVLPESIKTDYPGVAQRLEDMQEKHQEFADKGYGLAVVVHYESSKNKARLKPENLAIVVERWTETGAL